MRNGIIWSVRNFHKSMENVAEFVSENAKLTLNI